MIKGVRKKTDPYDYLGHLVPLLGGEFSEQESYLSKSDLFGGMDNNASLALSLSIQFMYF